MRVDDAAGKKSDGRVEEAGALGEEGPLLGEVHLESLVDRHLGLVGFHLTEVGVERPVERERAGHDHLGVEAATKVLLRAKGGLRRRVLGTAENAVRNQLDARPRRNIRHPLEGGHLPGKALDPIGDARPERNLLVVGTDASKCDAPLLFRPIREAEALEGDRHQHHEAGGRQAPLRAPDCIEVEIGV
jgi:hypothetical protein